MQRNKNSQILLVGMQNDVLNIRLPHNLEISLYITNEKWKRMSIKDFYMNVHSRIIQNSQKTDTTQMTISWWKDK